MTSRSIWLASVCAAGILSAAEPALAQDAAPLSVQTASSDSSTAPQSGEILVTARKRQENIVDTPLSISAYSSETLANRGVPNIHQLDTISPSLTVTNFGAGNVSDATISSAASAPRIISSSPIPVSGCISTASISVARWVPISV